MNGWEILLIVFLTPFACLLGIVATPFVTAIIIGIIGLIGHLIDCLSFWRRKK